MRNISSGLRGYGPAYPDVRKRQKGLDCEAARSLALAHRPEDRRLELGLGNSVKELRKIVRAAFQGTNAVGVEGNDWRFGLGRSRDRNGSSHRGMND
jgi:hypothetical protein